MGGREEEGRKGEREIGREGGWGQVKQGRRRIRGRKERIGGKGQRKALDKRGEEEEGVQWKSEGERGKGGGGESKEAEKRNERREKGLVDSRKERERERVGKH